MIMRLYWKLHCGTYIYSNEVDCASPKEVETGECKHGSESRRMTETNPVHDVLVWYWCSAIVKDRMILPVVRVIYICYCMLMKPTNKP